MKQLIPKSPINGFTYAQLLRNSLLWKGLITYYKGLWILSEDFYELDDFELNELLNQYLTYRDQ